ncbi:MAG: hypothetical protein AAF790_05070 [Planctomycetota bacterium]
MPPRETARLPSGLSTVTLTTGERLTGVVSRVPGEGRIWLRMTGTATVVLRPVPLTRVASIRRLTAPPPTRATPPGAGDAGASDATLAQRLLFGTP